MKILNETSVKLECKAGSCCPIIKKLENQSFEVTDDYDGKVLLTKEQLLMFKDAIDYFSGKE
jgi:hypothetical protein